jgi:hypothetical protein
MLQRSAVESEGGHFYALSRAISELCDKIPVPDPLPAFRHAALHGASDDEPEQPSVPQSTPVRVSSDIYKYRSSKKERAFVPQSPTARQQSADFLHLDVSTAATHSGCAEGRGSEARCKRVQFHYQPLRLKHAVPNPKKTRRKQLQRKRK